MCYKLITPKLNQLTVHVNAQLWDDVQYDTFGALLFHKLLIPLPHNTIEWFAGYLHAPVGELKERETQCLHSPYTHNCTTCVHRDCHSNRVHSLYTYSLYTVHCTHYIFTVYSALYTLFYSEKCIRCTVYKEQCVQCTVYTIHCIYCSLYTLHRIHYSLYTVHCISNILHCAIQAPVQMRWACNYCNSIRIPYCNNRYIVNNIKHTPCQVDAYTTSLYTLAMLIITLTHSEALWTGRNDRRVSRNLQKKDGTECTVNSRR